jgi:hypothetical protein
MQTSLNWGPSHLAVLCVCGEFYSRPASSLSLELPPVCGQMDGSEIILDSVVKKEFHLSCWERNHRNRTRSLVQTQASCPNGRGSRIIEYSVTFVFHASFGFGEKNLPSNFKYLQWTESACSFRLTERENWGKLFLTEEKNRLFSHRRADRNFHQISRTWLSSKQCFGRLVASHPNSRFINRRERADPCKSDW